MAGKRGLQKNVSWKERVGIFTKYPSRPAIYTEYPRPITEAPDRGGRTDAVSDQKAEEQ